MRLPKSGARDGAQQDMQRFTAPLCVRCEHDPCQRHLPAAVPEGTAPTRAVQPQPPCSMNSCCSAQHCRCESSSRRSIVYILDFGGGSCMHLSPGFLKICLTHGIRPFFVPAYTTKAPMPLGQVPHAPMFREWAMLRQLLAQRSRLSTAPLGFSSSISGSFMVRV